MTSPVVTIRHGQLQGCVRSNIDGEKYFSFLGIPYAKPPLGELRFKAPVPIEEWNGVKDATKEGDCCYSRNDITGAIEGSEDCLHLNVFTKQLPQPGGKPKPVMVWIHGGGFIYGSNRTSIYGPEFLMIEDIVLVSINYRLGLLGFLSLDDLSLDVPGNAGLKDQVLALKWVQANIQFFNGDPNNVTIFGESAGGASVNFHVLSSCSKGLFHRAIMQSGSALNSWAYGSCSSQILAANLDKEVKSENEILQILKEMTVEALYELQGKFEKIKPSEKRLVGVVIEAPNETAFLTKEAINIIKSGEYNKVPMLFGYTNREGIFGEFVQLMFKKEKEEINKETSILEENIPWQVIPKDNNIYQLICKKIKEKYFNGGDEQDNKFMLMTDSWFLAGIAASVKNHLATSSNPIYFYRMSLEAGLNYIKNLGKLHHIPGVSHADDLGYLFKSSITPEIKPGSIEDISVRRFVKLWTNFAKYGNPTPDEELGVTWPPVKKGELNFLDIGRELVLGANPEPERLALWKEIFQLNPHTADFL